MKKTLITLFLVAVLVLPLPSKAMTSEEAAQFQAIIDVLIQQVIALQQQLLVLLQKQNEIAAQQTEIVTTQTQILGKVAEPVVIPVNKEIKIVLNASYENQNGKYHNIFISYLEDGREVPVEITVSADDEGVLYVESQEQASAVSRKRGNGVNVFVQYMPKAEGTRTLTATANGASGSIQVHGK